VRRKKTNQPPVVACPEDSIPSEPFVPFDPSAQRFEEEEEASVASQEADNQAFLPSSYPSVDLPTQYRTIV
jgi:hypothetical protein